MLRRGGGGLGAVFFRRRSLDPRGKFFQDLAGGRLLGGEPFQFLGQCLMAVETGLLVDFVAGAIGSQARHRALELQQVELCLLQFMLELGQAAVRHRQLAIALLENRVRTAEQIELFLAVMGPGICLGCDLAQLHLVFGQAVASRGHPLLQTRALDPGQSGAIFRLLFLGLKIVDRALRFLRPLQQAAALRLPAFQGRLPLFELRPALGGGGAQ